jgi:hypothetical protein
MKHKFLAVAMPLLYESEYLTLTKQETGRKEVEKMRFLIKEVTKM